MEMNGFHFLFFTILPFFVCLHEKAGMHGFGWFLCTYRVCCDADRWYSKIEKSSYVMNNSNMRQNTVISFLDSKLVYFTKRSTVLLDENVDGKLKISSNKWRVKTVLYCFVILFYTITTACICKEPKTLLVFFLYCFLE